MLSVYMGAVKSGNFDYYKPYSGQDKDTASYTYCPDRIIKSDIATGGDLVCPLYYAILDDKDSVQTDWGCWVLKKTKQDLIQFVQDNHTWEPRVLKEVMNALKDGEEYLLTKNTCLQPLMMAMS